MDEELISELIDSLSREEVDSLADAIKVYLLDEPELTLDGRVNDLFAYFKNLPSKYKSIFIFIFKTSKKDNFKLEELEFLFQKKHIKEIFTELDTMSDDVQKEFFNNIYLDIASRYEYFMEKKGTKKIK